MRPSPSSVYNGPVRVPFALDRVRLELQTYLVTNNQAQTKVVNTKTDIPPNRPQLG